MPKSSLPGILFLKKKENRYLWYILILPAYLIAFALVEALVPESVCWPTYLPIEMCIRDSSLRRVSISRFPSVFDGKESAPHPACAWVRRMILPVSYTHLDVYKRQPI